MNGDVLELPHQRDDALLDQEAQAINKFYVVTDGNRSSSGYSQTWHPHVWRIKCTPLTNSQEYSDVLDKTADDPFGLPMSDNLRNLMGNVGLEMGINDAVIEEAKEYVSGRNFETQHFYVVPGDERGIQFPWIFAGDGVPPNGAILTGSGTAFPENAQEGDYFLRPDYEPAVLFRKEAKKWVRIELDYRKQDWSMAHRLLESFINNTKSAKHDDGTITSEKKALSKAVSPKADF